MTRKQDLQNTVLDLSHKVVKSFYSRRTETILPLLDEQFLWIGSLSFQWTEGPAAFGQLKRSEGASTSVPDIGNEYYNILSSDGRTWVVCGRFTVSLRVDADVICRLLIRVTLVWSQKGERAILSSTPAQLLRQGLSANRKFLPGDPLLLSIPARKPA